MFKDLISQMLNPSKEKRLSIDKVKKHDWIAGAFLEEYPPIDDIWKQKLYKAYSVQTGLSVDIVRDKIAKNPYGKMGGMFNIEKYTHQVEHMKVKKAPSSGKVQNVKVINVSLQTEQLNYYFGFFSSR